MFTGPEMFSLLIMVQYAHVTYMLLNVAVSRGRSIRQFLENGAVATDYPLAHPDLIEICFRPFNGTRMDLSDAPIVSFVAHTQCIEEYISTMIVHPV